MREQQAGTYEVSRRGRFTPNIVSAPGSLLSVLTEVSLGVGMSVIPGVVRNIVQLPNVAFCPIAGEAISSEVAAIFRADESSPTAKNFVQQLRASAERQFDPGDWNTRPAYSRRMSLNDFGEL
jgi:DNA-binding transcriptional LysR family regulator